MNACSSALTTTLRALHGESDVHVGAPARYNHVDSVIGAPGALAGKLPSVLPAHVLESPARSAAVASLIGTDVGDRILPTWAKVAPAAWSASHAATFIDAVGHERRPRRTAAALIGPCDTSAALSPICRTSPALCSAAERRYLTT